MDLSLVPVEDLYQEICSRFDHVVFMGKKIDGKDTKTSRRWNGDEHLCAGLCMDMATDLMEFYKDREQSITPEDL